MSNNMNLNIPNNSENQIMNNNMGMNNIYLNNNMNMNMNYYNNMYNPMPINNQGFGMNNMNNMNMFPINNPMGMNPMGMNPMGPMNQMNNPMINNNIPKSEQNLNRLKYLLGDINNYLFCIQNDINEIETILNEMKKDGLDNGPKYFAFKNLYNNIRNNFNNFSNPSNFNENKKIDVIFRSSGFNENDPFSKVLIKCSFDEQIKEVIKRYRDITNKNTDKYKFIYNARNLNQSLTVAEAGLTQNANIFVVGSH
jgi:hypothetical protein